MDSKQPHYRKLPNLPDPFTTDGRSVDLRESFRVPIQVSGLFCAQTEDDICDWIPCHITNISGGGAQVTTRTDTSHFPLHTALLLKFRIGNLYQLQASLVWQDLIESHARLGVAWYAMSERQQQQLSWELMRLAVRRRRHP